MKENAFRTADILIPKDADMTKWSVVACDQYTSEPAYWEKAAQVVGDEPSTLHMIFPEAYLENEPEKRIKAINEKMTEYADGGVFKTLADSFVYVERTQQNGKVRRGLVGAVDLMQYDYNKGSGSAVRATEGTVLDRLPPRIKIRIDAPLELPHIMLLIDDPAKKVIESLDDKKKSMEKVYDFELMAGGGHIRGWRVCGDDADAIMALLDENTSESAFAERYGCPEKPVLAYAVGDGNHSLATARECFLKLTANMSEQERLAHPARFALAELVNLHDDSLEFEPIHRVVFGVDADKMLKEIKSFYETAEIYEENYNGEKVSGQTFKYVYKGEAGTVVIPASPYTIEAGTLQAFIDKYIAENGGTVDYIHGDDVTVRLGSEDGNIGFLLAPMAKSDLFKTVIFDGALPRKTFSMGEAHDKRFYLECRKIR